ncbi:DUF1819 family protein [Endozoicomonas gorgoniicola]|uniref:DUF1819 family protein n=1 Tax=Endozoicomonas gorgoniicola TaxID=1234144 RepID=A0ABT3N1S0_9GAMM|nr:DUF1819 family protein [Endozoicomonas gorgoniicola]MCW7555582.1 DUF1819 family protein [Endozoicomonas gorgoniicola]
MAQNVYPANFTKGSLLIPESKIIAGILLQEPSPAEWKRQIVDENILQRRTTNSALIVAGVIRSRLKTVNEELWKLVHTGG